MSLWTRLIITIGKFVSLFSSTLHFGAGATWPGEIALMLRPNITSHFVQQLRKGVILIAGTNGKTTTSLMIKKILEGQGEKVIHNASGANLLNGVVSSCIQGATWFGNIRADWGVFEIDENSLPIVLKYITPKTIVLLNLFRDQLDRYGEVDVIVEKWEKSLTKLSRSTIFVLNSDDPAIAYLGKEVKGNVIYFGIDDKKYFLQGPEHATDSIFCMNCGGRLSYEGIYYSHIGIWHCPKCGFRRPKPSVSVFASPLLGLYNQYNTLAAVATGKALHIADKVLKTSLSNFSPAFGRQEEFRIDGRKVKIFLSKNPTGFNASLRTVLEQGEKVLLLILNDRIPDGRDVSWIWDVDFETIPRGTAIVVSGDRVYDLAIRLKYAGETESMIVEPDLSSAIQKAVRKTPREETLFILPTYSAMLDVRKILLGKKIL